MNALAAMTNMTPDELRRIAGDLKDMAQTLTDTCEGAARGLHPDAAAGLSDHFANLKRQARSGRAAARFFSDLADWKGKS